MKGMIFEGEGDSTKYRTVTCTVFSEVRHSQVSNDDIHGEKLESSGLCTCCLPVPVLSTSPAWLCTHIDILLNYQT